MKRAVGLFFLLVSQGLFAAVSFDEAFRAALKRSEAMGISEQAVVQSEEALSQARGALMPAIGFNALHTTTPAPPPGFEEFAPQHQTTLSFGLVQPVFKGLREYAGLRKVGNLRAASGFKRDAAKLTLFGEVAQNYFTVLNLEQDVRNLQQQVDIYQKRIGDLQGRKRRGESNASDVLSARAFEASLEAELRLIQSQVLVAREGFAFYTGLERNSELKDPQLAKPVPGLDTLLAQLEKRPEILAAGEALKASEEDVSIAWGGHLPSVDLMANVYLLRPGFMKDYRWDVGGKLTFPLFAGGAVSSQVREAMSKRTQSELEMHRLRRLAEQQIRALHASYTARVEHLDKLKVSLQLADQNSQVLQRDYKRGLVRNIDVQLALTEAGSSRRRLDQARFQAQTEYLSLQIATAQLPETGEATK
ncbi:TolC family protein [bacterium]|nr:TolC family protein [bacterium]